MTPQQFSSEDLGKNLEFARAVHESFSGSSNRVLCDTVTVAIGNSSAMQSNRGFDASSETQQVTNRDILFIRFVRPFGDGVSYSIVQVEDAVLLSSNGRYTPESFGTAENRNNLVRSIPTGIRLVENATILYHQQRKTSTRHRVFLRSRTRGGREFPVRRTEYKPASY